LNKIDELLYKDYTFSQFAFNTASGTVTDNVASLTAERDELLGILTTINGEMAAYIPSKLSTTLRNLYWSTANGTVKGYIYALGLDNTSGLDDVTYVSANQFSCLNDHTLSVGVSGTALITPTSGNVAAFPSAEGNLVCDCGSDGLKYVYVGSSIYDLGLNTTTVELSGGTITSNITKVYYYDDVYNRTTNWDSDTYISQREDEWAFTYDHLYAALGTATGSYGVVARLAAASSSSGMMAVNKAKNDLYDSTYSRFTSWTKVADNTTALPDVDYVSELVFTCDGDLTTSLPISASIKMDCGTDGIKGGIIYTTTYTPTSAGSYTEIILNPDLINNEVDVEFMLTGNLTTVSVSGSIVFDNTNPSLPDAVYVNELTFKVPGDYTSTFIAADTIDVVCDCGTDGEPHFTVYSSTHKTDPYNITTIEYREGLPITANITSVSVNTT